MAGVPPEDGGLPLTTYMSLTTDRLFLINVSSSKYFVVNLHVKATTKRDSPTKRDYIYLGSLSNHTTRADPRDGYG